MSDLYNKYKVSSPPTQYNESEVGNFFFQQQAAMLLFEEATVPIAQKYLPEGAVGVSHWPVANKEQLAQGKIYDRGWAATEVVASASKHKKAALQWAKYLGSPFVIKWFTESAFFPSPRKDVEAGKDMVMLRQLYDMAKYMKFDPKTIFAPRLQVMLGDSISAVLGGQKTPDKALSDLASEMEGFLNGD